MLSLNIINEMFISRELRMSDFILIEIILEYKIFWSGKTIKKERHIKKNDNQRKLKNVLHCYTENSQTKTTTSLKLSTWCQSAMHALDSYCLAICILIGLCDFLMVLE